MEFDNSFEVPLPPDEAWAVLMDIRRVAPCMPGAELTAVVDVRTYKGRIGVRLGPVALTFAGTVKFEEIDDAGHTARVAAQGSDAKGRGAASAAASFRLEPAGSGTRVLVHTNLVLSGAVVQYGRGAGIIQLTAAQIVARFADNLKAQLAKEGAAVQEAASGGGSVPPPDAAVTARDAPGFPENVAAAPPAKPISGLALMAQVLWSLVRGLFGRR